MAKGRGPTLTTRMTKLEELVNKILVDMATMATDLKWIKKGFAVFIGLLVTIAGGLILVYLQARMGV